MNGKPPGREAEEAKAEAEAVAEGESTPAVEQDQALEAANESTEIKPEVQGDASAEKEPEVAADASVKVEDAVAEDAVVEQLKELDVNDQETFPEEDDVEEEDVEEDDGAGEWISMFNGPGNQFK